jgi:hypothetical protein
MTSSSPLGPAADLARRAVVAAGAARPAEPAPVARPLGRHAVQHAFLPFYDYYLWLFQGHVVSVLLFGSDAGSTGLAGDYFLSPVPVPNLAAPIAIGALDAVLPTEAAGQLFAVLTVLGFAVAFGVLVRTIQQRRPVVRPDAHHALAGARRSPRHSRGGEPR